MLALICWLLKSIIMLLWDREVPIPTMAAFVSLFFSNDSSRKKPMNLISWCVLFCDLVTIVVWNSLHAKQTQGLSIYPPLSNRKKVPLSSIQCSTSPTLPLKQQGIKIASFEENDPHWTTTFHRGFCRSRPIANVQDVAAAACLRRTGATTGGSMGHWDMYCTCRPDKNYKIPQPLSSMYWYNGITFEPFWYNDCNILPSVNTFRYHVYITGSRYKG